MRRGEDKKPPTDDTGWQRQAWLWYDTIGEYRYACSWVGNLLSRAKLFVKEGGAATTNSDAIEAMRALFGGEEGQREMLRQLGIQFTVAGEGYLIGEDGGNDPGDKWWVVAASEISKSGDQWRVGKKDVDNPLVMRLWRPHPRVNNKPDAPSRAVLPILSEIDGLTKHVAAQISRLLVSISTRCAMSCSVRRWTNSPLNFAKRRSGVWHSEWTCPRRCSPGPAKSTTGARGR
jgi:hypothetical protein